MIRIACAAFASLLFFAASAGAEAPNDEAQAKAQRDFVASLTKRHGAVKLPSAHATLNVPSQFYFLDAKDARRVLEEAWGNPPDETVLGMILPTGHTPFSDRAWAATFSYQADGYVSDDDAAKINYDSLMRDLQKDARDSNSWRRQEGYPEVEIVGWADKPVYLSADHKMYWAKELKFGDSTVNTLNYDIRVLGRRGVLVVGFIAEMDQLGQIKQAAPAVLKLASFDEGARYADYVEGVDKKAAYGLAGLVAGGLIAKKTGLLAAALLFGKKFFAVIIAALAGAGAWLRRRFGGGNT